MSRHLEVFAIPGVPRIAAGDDLASMICARTRLRSGDVLAVTSKVVSKSEGRVRQGGRDVAVDAEVDRVVARRGATVIARTRTGLVLAAAGVDASNVDVGNVVLLPLDPDSSARALRERVATIAGVDVAVVVTDTAGRAWRVGQTDIAIGCAGLAPLDDHAGRHDPFGNVLQVTAPAIADEVAAAADLVKGKTGSTPVAVLRGTPLVVLPRGEHGPGAAALVRDPAEDLFGLGSQDAVRAAALRSDAQALAAFPAQAAALEELLAMASKQLDPTVEELRGVAGRPEGPQSVHGRIRAGGVDVVPSAAAVGAAAERLCALAVSSGWVVAEPTRSRLPAPAAVDGWQTILILGLAPRPS